MPVQNIECQIAQAQITRLLAGDTFSSEVLAVEEGLLYPTLQKMLVKGFVTAEWGISDNNRKAKFYSITPDGRKQLEKDAAYWQRLSDVMGRVLAMTPEGNLQ